MMMPGKRQAALSARPVRLSHRLPPADQPGDQPGQHTRRNRANVHQPVTDPATIFGAGAPATAGALDGCASVTVSAAIG